MSDLTAQSPTDWADFDRRIRLAGRPLLRTLGNYRRPILVSGCQRSGTTAVATLLKLATSARYPDLTGDGELDDALVLCGEQPWEFDQRFCFQTTYLNEQFDEYWQHDHYTMVWVLREPAAVVRSMLTNWSSDALNRLYRGVGQRHRNGLRAPLGIYRFLPGAEVLSKACASYLGKLQQLETLRKTLPAERFLLVDFGELLKHKSAAVRLLCDRLDLNFNSALSDTLGRQRKRLRPRLMLQSIDRVAEENCGAAYRDCLRHVTRAEAA